VRDEDVALARELVFAAMRAGNGRGAHARRTQARRVT
jgi:hypothetical protein